MSDDERKRPLNPTTSLTRTESILMLIAALATLAWIGLLIFPLNSRANRSTSFFK